MRTRIIKNLFSSDEAHPTHHELILLGREWGWLLAAGIAFVVLGLIALSMPVVSTVSLTFAVAVLLLVSGGIYLVQGVRLRHRHGSASRFLRAVLALVVGALILRFPTSGMLGVALGLTFYFMASATMQWILFFDNRSLNGAGWVLISSITSFLLGLYMIFTFPFSALWVPGLLLGVDLAFSGFSMIGWAFAVRQLNRRTQADVGTTRTRRVPPGTLQPSVP